MEFLSASALCVVVMWLNEKYGLRKLLAERDRFTAINADSL
jgi:hypothetical protein